MTPPEPRGGEGLTALMASLAEEIAVAAEQSDATPMERFVSEALCSDDAKAKGLVDRVWIVSLPDARKAIAAVEAWNRRPSSPPSGGGGWPSREAVEAVILRAMADGQGDADIARVASSDILALFPPVVGWPLREREDDLVAALRSIAEGNLGDQPWQAGYETIKQVARNAIAYRNALPSAPLTTDHEGHEA